ncbi:class I mannose-6-phosphate isomerase [Sphingopyxis alaskensis]|jgi:mannose-6-phosphate isomerase|uniref:Phosphomannose isomerase-like protein n=1 Tax=Sphingopyxis alaskensis (strain DSM 13593 / LMG 18877 / RB2256) TaxID=317655 RepID=Q1GSR7_SPHAL|nr:class I mannose-6-phosphate isomerase [Sphingopyxis alaskensis]ABF53305.1 Phosphomannose isomerase-like protein [Sphingopyxis alaskensis RB2256]MCM3418725.1 class I mannose-6-phosphate isomerase [Sphingopyxis alaskensis]
MLSRLETIIVEKPWGRTDIAGDFGDFGDRRVGEIWFSHPDGRDAPIMVKFLFTSERLSIQVHPDDEAAITAGYPRGKEECWLVLNADPGAELGVGLNAPTTSEALRHAALDGTIVNMVDWRAARTDDFIYNPAGTIHAIGGGLVIVEVQQNIDCTYRLYDYGRPRELHLDEGLAVAATKPVADPRDGRVDPARSRLLVDGPHFGLLHLAGADAAALLPHHHADYIFTPLSPGCAIAGEPIGLGECVATDRADAIALEPGARALLSWPT